MALGELVIFGTVTDIGERSGTGERGPWRIVTAYIAGARQTYAVQLSDELAARGVLDVGQDVALSVYTRVFRDRVDLRATGFWSGAEGDVSAGSRAVA